MNKPIIEVDRLSKLYKLGAVGATTLRESFEKWWHRIQGKEHLLRPIGHKPLMIEPDDPQAGPEPNTLWALKDVSFTVNQGEIVGIIGRNGAGKSTLLKILSKITEPTSGRAIVRGRISSLLEVGTGFHPELTGRENIYLNGTILGMRKIEVDKKFDEIVSFAEVEKFIGTPVKHYSSGMYVRLAFAVAAHLEPEILLVDEVLAVGDAAFQKKCLGKMENVARAGRTILFVSHQLDMVRALCNRSVLLSQGEIVSCGDSNKVIQDYLHSLTFDKGRSYLEVTRDDNLALQVVRARILNESGSMQSRFDVFDKIFIEIAYVVRKAMEGLLVNFELKRNGTTLFLSFDSDTDENKFESRLPGTYRSLICLPCPLLKPGYYTLSINAGIVNTVAFQRLEDALTFDVVVESKPSTFLSYAEKRPGVIAVPLVWETTLIDAVSTDSLP